MSIRQGGLQQPTRVEPSTTSEAANKFSTWAPSKSEKMDGMAFKNPMLSEDLLNAEENQPRDGDTLELQETQEHLERLEEHVADLERRADANRSDNELVGCISGYVLWAVASGLLVLICVVACCAACVNAVQADTHEAGNVFGNYQVVDGKVVPPASFCAVHDCGSCPRAAWLIPTLILLWRMGILLPAIRLRMPVCWGYWRLLLQRLRMWGGDQSVTIFVEMVSTISKDELIQICNAICSERTRIAESALNMIRM